jgi:hypothetical protein
MLGREGDSKMPLSADFKLPPELELECIIGLEAAAKVSDLSPDTLKRRYPDKILKLSARRLGMRLRDALMLSKST